MRSFTVTALWDDEARVFYSESDIVGLHIEAETVDEFIALMRDLAPQMIAANHPVPGDMMQRPLAELIPSIVFERPPVPA